MAGFDRQLAVSFCTHVSSLLDFCKPLCTFQDTDVEGILSSGSCMQQTPILACLATKEGLIPRHEAQFLSRKLTKRKLQTSFAGHL